MYCLIKVVTIFFICILPLQSQCCNLLASISKDSEHQQPHLSSWNDGPAKQAIIDFVTKTCNRSSVDYVAPENRIATFDQDGTLWVEYPLYTQAAFSLDRLKTLASDHPEWQHEEPFKAALSGSHLFSEQQWAEIIAATHANISIETFKQLAHDWLTTAQHPRFKRPYTELIYQPMVEVLEYLRANGFKTYIVTGGGQEFVRVYSQQVYGIPTEQVIGSSITTVYKKIEGKPELFRLPKVFFIDDHAGKAVGINLFIGKRPLASFGNSTGDTEMLEWTQAGEGARLMMLIHHDDDQREYSYGIHSPIGTFSEELMKQAKEQNWIVVSMKNDWKQIFKPNANPGKQQIK